MQSLWPKFDELCVFVSRFRPHIVVLCETWLNSSVDDNRLTIPYYLPPFRCDRMERQGGGVCCYVRQDVKCRCLFLDTAFVTETVWLEFIDLKIFLCAVYVPPNLRSATHCEILDEIQNSADRCLESSPDGHIMILGDINDLPTASLESELDVVQIVRDPTRKNSVLDKIMISKSLLLLYKPQVKKRNNSKSMPQITIGAPIGKSDHCTVLLTPDNDQNLSPAYKSKTLYDLRHSNVSRFVSDIEQVDWSFATDVSLDFESRCVYFHEKLVNVFDDSIPSFTVALNAQDKPWMTPLLKYLINQRWLAFREKDFGKYQHLKGKCTLEIKKAKRIWAQKVSKKNIWKVVKSTRGKDSADSLTQFSQTFASHAQAANALNENFLSQCQPCAYPGFHDSCVVDLQMSSCWSITPYEVMIEFDKLSDRKSSFDVPAKLLKAVSHVIAEPLSTLFNYSLTHGVVPQIWKCAKVIPVPKSSSMELDNFRPISILPEPMKIFEKLILKRIKSRLLVGFGPNQFGFRPSSSTTCALIAVHDFITRWLENPEVNGVQITAYDFSKAFDRIKHDVILNRLSVCGIPMIFLRWFEDYLKNRQQFVQIGPTKSIIKNVPSGVPQGSILGPYLFSLTTGSFTIDEAIGHGTKVVMYADDFTICAPLFRGSSNSHVREVHDLLLSWSARMSFHLNLRKCKCLTIPRNPFCSAVELNDVTFVNELKLLGVTINRKGNWTHHVNKVVSYASRLLYVVRVLKSILPREEIIPVYNALIRSCLEYSSPILVGMYKNNAEKLERVQRRFHRILCGPDCSAHKLPSLSQRRQEAAIKLFKKVQSPHHILHSLSPSLSSAGRIILPHILHTRRLNSFFIKVAIILNCQHRR